MRSIGNSATPLVILIISSGLNIILDLLFIIELNKGIAGTALATVISQGVSAVIIFVYCYGKTNLLNLNKAEISFDRHIFNAVFKYSIFTALQQSVMNLGILMVQGLVNTFGITVMAAFAAAVKIDSFAYRPLQDFGNAFSTFIAQNHGAEKKDRIRQGLKSAILISGIYAVIISVIVFIFGKWLMLIFIKENNTEIIAIGAKYLRIEGTFYVLIACLFLLYGFYRGIGRPALSFILTVISLGTRVGLSYAMAHGYEMAYLWIWWSIPIGWFLADLIGVFLILRNEKIKKITECR